MCPEGPGKEKSPGHASKASETSRARLGHRGPRRQVHPLHLSAHPLSKWKKRRENLPENKKATYSHRQNRPSKQDSNPGAPRYTKRSLILYLLPAAASGQVELILHSKSLAEEVTMTVEGNRGQQAPPSAAKLSDLVPALPPPLLCRASRAAALRSPCPSSPWRSSPDTQAHSTCLVHPVPNGVPCSCLCHLRPTAPSS